MSKRDLCPYCKQPRGGRPLARGTGYHLACYEDALLEQERKATAVHVSDAERAYYWDQWVEKVKDHLYDASVYASVDEVVAALAHRSHRPKVDKFTVLMAGRRFEDAGVV